MSRGVLTIISVYAILILVVIAGFFLLGFEHTALNFWAFGSLLFSLMVALFATIKLATNKKKNKEKLFYSAGISSAILLYGIAVVISILFTNAFTDNLNAFILVQITINAVFIIIEILIIAFSGRMHDSNVKTQESLEKGDYNKPKRGGI